MSLSMELRLTSLRNISCQLGNIKRSLILDKAHRHNNISIRMLKICDTAIV